MREPDEFGPGKPPSVGVAVYLVVAFAVGFAVVLVAMAIFG